MTTAVLDDRPTVSIVLSFRNEAETIREMVARLEQVLTGIPVEYEVIWVNDASTDASVSIILELASQNPRIKLINMSRRFGVNECVVAGMKYARGDAVVMMDADLQDPPELLPRLIEEWRRGADVVYTVRLNRLGESAVKMLITKLAYRFISAISDIKLPVDAGDFKLLSRQVADQVVKLEEKKPYLRGLVTWLGYRQVPVHYERQARFAGTTHFPLLGSRGPIRMFVAGITSFSNLPLVGSLLAGLAVGALSLAALAIMALLAILVSAPATWLIVMAGVGLLAGLQLVGIGTVGLYLGRVLDEVRRRPNYVVESTHGFDAERHPTATANLTR
jgi:polyisoprenyl-phosphate glycosyltransferase